jgi:tRNA uridine 5-carbamoylmethylation protein Kti12
MILITGKEGAGKTTLAKLLEERISEFMWCQRMAFADEVKRDWVDEKYLHDRNFYDKYLCRTPIVELLEENREFKEKYRDELIKLAEEKKEKYGSNYWAERMMEEYDSDHLLIVSDFRFREELLYLLSKGNSIKNGSDIIIVNLSGSKTFGDSYFSDYNFFESLLPDLKRSPETRKLVVYNVDRENKERYDSVVEEIIESLKTPVNGKKEL